MSETGLAVIAAASNPTRLWGMSVDERLARIAGKAGLATAATAPEAAPVLLVNRRFVFDPAWLGHFAARPGEALTLAGVPVIAHCRTPGERAEALRAMEEDAPLGPDTRLTVSAHESGGAIEPRNRSVGQNKAAPLLTQRDEKVFACVGALRMTGNARTPQGGPDQVRIGRILFQMDKSQGISHEAQDG